MDIPVKLSEPIFQLKILVEVITIVFEAGVEINGEMVFAELLDAIKARQIYEDIVRQIKDPALLEYTGQGIFKVRIFPIEPKSKKKVKISYREVLSSDNGLYEYIYPLNTEKFSAKPVKNVRVKVDLKTNKEIKNIYSPTHPVDVVNKDNHNAVISFEEENTKPDIDFKLYYNTNNDDVGLSLLTYKTGSDDGYVYLTRDGGQEWERISDALPPNLWVSRVIASEHEKERVYVALNGYRYDDFKPYLFVSEDSGRSWNPIHSNLPDSPINVIREDTVDASILYLGNDHGVYVSFDRGQNWQAFSEGLPKVAVHDLRIQDEAKDLVVGTHGRSIYKANIATVQKYNSIKDEAVTVFALKDIRHSSRWGSSWGQWYDAIVPAEIIEFYTGASGKLTIEILGEDEYQLNSFSIDAKAGYNSFEYDLSVSEKSTKAYFKKKDIAIEEAANGNYYLPKGKYEIKVSIGGNSAKTDLTIK